jgi:plasmid stability protein
MLTDTKLRNLKPRAANMRAVTIRNVPEEVHRAIRVTAAQNGRTLQAEMCDILAAAVKPEGRRR